MKIFFPIATAFFLNSALAGDTLPEKLQPCVAMLRDAERLACFDKAIAQIQNGTETAAPTAENMFGANSGITPARGEREVKREELREIKGVVTSLRRVDDGMIILEMDNGQVWRQQDSDATLVIDTGDPVTIMRAAMGTFRISDKRGRSARFTRVR